MRRTLPVLAVLVVTVAGCVGPFGGDTKPKSDFRLEDVRTMRHAPFYFVGESFAGLPLTAIVGSRNEVSFIYGDCEIEDQGWFEDGGCEPPLTIQNRRCKRGGVTVAIYATDSAVARQARRDLRRVNDVEPTVATHVATGSMPGCY